MSGLTFIDNTFVLHKRGSNSHNFQAARMDTDSTVKYFGWLAADGSHIIMEKDDTDEGNASMKYFWGDSSQAFATNWTNRAALSYVEYDALI